jgi:hypothetical protein
MLKILLMKCYCGLKGCLDKMNNFKIANLATKITIID